MKALIHISCFMAAVTIITSCEQEYIPDVSGEGPKYVVEGYIEAGENPFPPYVILTRSFDFYSTIDPDQFSESFIHDADVFVSDGTTEIKFEEICFEDLPPEIRNEAAAQFGFNGDSLQINFCVYTDLSNQLQPQVNRTYDLRIITGSDTLTASTFIPPHVPLDSIRFLPPPGQPNDSLAQLRASVTDPPGIRNFYRFFIQTDNASFNTLFSSVEEDLFFDGKAFEFQLLNPRTTDGDADPDEFGLYFVGDSITIKWCSIDEAHFDFWNTLEFNRANQGPFSSYTRIKSNINGGLGIWGGYSVSYYSRIVAY